MDYIEKRFCYTTPTDLNMYYCGKRIKTENHSYGPQVRDHFLLVYIKEGTATLTIGDSCFDLCGGQLLCMFPGEKIYYKANDCLWSNLWVGVYGNQAEYYLKNLGITRKYPIYTCPQPHETEKIIDEIIVSAEINNAYGNIKTIAKLYDFFSSLYDKSAVRFSDNVSVFDISDTHEITYLSENIYIREAENYIRFHYDSEISINKLAASLNLSAEYFSRLFKSETGMTPQNMVIKYRTEKARRLLSSTSLSINEIAACIGIHDQRYFSKLFKEKFGCSPTEYRKSKSRKNA